MLIFIWLTLKHPLSCEPISRISYFKALEWLEFDPSRLFGPWRTMMGPAVGMPDAKESPTGPKAFGACLGMEIFFQGQLV